jgi:hypothetical protein
MQTVCVYKCGCCRDKFDSKRFKDPAKATGSDCPFVVKTVENFEAGTVEIVYINPYHSEHSYDPSSDHNKLKASNREIPDVVKHKIEMMYNAKGVPVSMMERIIRQVHDVY